MVNFDFIITITGIYYFYETCSMHNVTKKCTHDGRRHNLTIPWATLGIVNIKLLSIFMTYSGYLPTISLSLGPP